MADTIKFIEFYSGIGGWSHALEKVLGRDRIEVVGAFDHSTICNTVYKENLNFAPSQKPIESLTSNLLDKLSADLWVMSPPCQPYTRQRNELENQLKDDDDPRAKSFLHLCSMLGQLENPPNTIVLENVVGFEQSDCCKTWLQALVDNGYTFEHFHLTPSDFNFPNERPRYYLIAHKTQSEGKVSKKLSHTSSDTVKAAVEIANSSDDMNVFATEGIDVPISTFKLVSIDKGVSADVDDACDDAGSGRAGRREIKDFLELPEEYSEAPQGFEDQQKDSLVHGLPDWLKPWAIDAKVLNKDAAWCFDIVKSSDSNTACFTRSYSRYNKGTGSVLYVPRKGSQTAKKRKLQLGGGLSANGEVGGDTDEATINTELVSPSEREFDTKWKTRISQTGTLRYFTPREVANLLGFPSQFHFPEHVKSRKAYEMLGNSLHIEVTAQVLRRALLGTKDY